MANYTTVCSPLLIKSPERLLLRQNIFPWLADPIGVNLDFTLTLNRPSIFYQIVKGGLYSEGPDLQYNQIDYSDIALQHADFISLGENIMNDMFSNTWIPGNNLGGITYSGNYLGYSARYGNYDDSNFNSVGNTYALFSTYWNNKAEYNPLKDLKAAQNIAFRSNLKACFLVPGVYTSAHLSSSWNDMYNFQLRMSNENRLPAYLGFELIQYS